MSDTAIGEAPAELDAVPPAPETAELEEAAVSAETPDQVAAPEIEHPIGPLRQALLDHLLDSQGPQTVAQIIAGVGNYSRNTVEGCLRRSHAAGEIERVGPGTYVLAKPKPTPSPPKPSPPLEPVQEPEPEPENDQARLDAALERDRL
jgi:hypothetical protein